MNDDNIPRWYLAQVANNTELSTMRKLMEIGEGFPAEGPAQYSVPLHKIEIVNPRRKVVTKIKPAIPGILFVRATNTVRYNLSRYPTIKRWVMSTTTDDNGMRLLATVSDKSMEEFEDMVKRLNGEYVIGNISEAVGRKVRFVAGPLKDKEGVLEEKDGRYLFCRAIGEEFIPGIITILSKQSAESWLEVIG